MAKPLRVSVYDGPSVEWGPIDRAQTEPLPMPDTLENQSVSYLSISAERLAELEAKAAKWDAVSLLDQFEKAAKWDTIAPKLQYLSDFFTDLKGGKP